jgi:3-dehydroquinate dehydratase type I
MKTNLCVSMTARSAHECMEFVTKCNSDLIEHRLDFMGRIENLEEIYDTAEAPVAVTCRSSSNGGYFMGSERERVGHLLDGISAGAAYVDVEIEIADPLFDVVSKAASSSGYEIIVSKHYHESTPELEDLSEMYHHLISKGAGIAKIVAFAKSMNDCWKTMKLYELSEIRKHKLIAFSMGDLGKITRLVALFLGAPFMYVSMDNHDKAAPGQLSLTQMRFLLEVLL